MRYLLIGILFCWATFAQAQIINDEIRYEVLLTEISIFDQDEEFGQEEFTVIAEVRDGNDNTSPETCISFNAEGGGNYTLTTSLNAEFYNRPYNDFFTIGFLSFEDDGGERCELDNGDDVLYSGTAIVNNSCIACNGRSSTWLQNLGNGVPWLGDNLNPNTSNWNFAIEGIWRYEAGDAYNTPLNFGIIEDGETLSHNNYTGEVSVGPYDFQYSNIEGSEANDVLYAFEISEAADVLISTDLAGTLFDTHLFLYDNDRNYITDNDDVVSGNTNSRIATELCPGRYFVLVTGYQGDEGSFDMEIGVTHKVAFNVPAPDLFSASCENEPDGAMTFAPSGGMGPYFYSIDGQEVSNPMIGLTPGTYEVVVSNGCMESSILEVTIDFFDQTPPTAVCPTGNTINLMPDEGAFLNAELFAANSFDNCGGPLTGFSISPEIIGVEDAPLVIYELRMEDAAGNVATCQGEIFVNVITSVAQNPQLEAALVAYPNPVQDVLNLKINDYAVEEGQLLLRNTSGQVVKSVHLGNTSPDYQMNLSMQALPAGVYTLQLQTNDGQLTRRIIKQ